MRFKSYIKDKLLLLFLIFFSIVSIEIILLAYNIEFNVRVYVLLAPLVATIIGLLIDFYNRKSYYDNLKKNLEDLDAKYLIPEIIGTPDFIDGKILKEVVQDAGKSMLENVNKYKYIQDDYKEYIELWIHEIKIPIATSKLIIENNKSKETKSIDEELGKIENFVEQVLYYARSNNVEKDYYISKTKLSEIVNSAILKNKNILLSNKINLEIGDIDKQVVTDSKWTIFILNQIIQTSVKYMNKDIKTMKIYAEEKKEKVILYIQDNGMGVGKGEIARVYDKGFTGENGRILGKKSTGIGLYLCKKLCDRLGLGIEFNSQKDIGTEVKIIFPVGSHTNI